MRKLLCTVALTLAKRAAPCFTAVLTLIAALGGFGATAGAQAPVFAAPLNPVFGSTGAPVTFSALLLNGTTATVDQFQWSFGDGQIGSGQVTTHTYFAPGVYAVTLTALGPSGPVASTSTTATIGPGRTGPGLPAVSGVIPGANSVASSLGYIGVNAGGPYSGSVGLPILFTGSASNAGAPQYVWDFGDNQGAAGASASHAYGAPGTFHVRLSVTDLVSGVTGTTTALATIVLAPAASVVAASPAPVVASVAGAGPAVTYPAGWNLIGGPAGTMFPQALSPIYTWRAGDSSYELARSDSGVIAGAGYWAYFPQAATVTPAGAASDSASVTVPAGQMVLIGNPSSIRALVIHGADNATIWDATGAQYRSAQALAPGTGAWVFVADGGVVTLSP